MKLNFSKGLRTVILIVSLSILLLLGLGLSLLAAGWVIGVLLPLYAGVQRSDPETMVVYAGLFHSLEYAPYRDERLLRLECSFLPFGGLRLGRQRSSPIQAINRSIISSF